MAGNRSASRKRLGAAVAMIALVAGVMGCGAGPDEGARATIGTPGGSLEIPGGGRLEVPAGALATDTEIRISSSTAPVEAGFTAAGPFFRFEPEGLVFAVPATITLPIDAEAAVAGADLGIAWGAAGEPWARLGGEAVTAGQVTAVVTHFSEGGAAAWSAGHDVCCLVTAADGPSLERTSAAACTERQGEALPVEQCGTVCCQDEVGLLKMRKAACEEFPGAAVYPAAACDVQVCCSTDEQTWSLMPFADCVAVSPEASACHASFCDTVCCQTADDAPALLSKGACGAQGGVETASDLCGDVCCQDASGALARVPASTCGANGIVVAGETCDTICCLREDGASPDQELGACVDGGGVPYPASACGEGCCRVQVDPPVHQALVLARCLHNGGAPADAVECLPVCCDAGGLGWVTPSTCAERGGQVLSDADCPPDGCSLDDVREGDGTLGGSLADYRDDAFTVSPPCDDHESTDPDKDNGPDLSVAVRIPPQACLLAKATVTGFNPSLAVLSACDPLAAACFGYTYGQPDVEPVYPVTYPFPAPGQVRKAAIEACPGAAEATDVALILDSGTEQSGGADGDTGRFRLDWRLLEGAPANDDAAKPKSIGPGAGAEIESARGATDDLQSEGCPGVADGAGTGTPDVWYAHQPSPAQPSQAGRVVVGLRVLNGNADDLAGGSHFVAVRDAGGACVAAGQGGRDVHVKVDAGAGGALNIGVDAGDLPEGALFEVSAEPYLGPANDDCGNAEIVADLPYEHAGTTVGAFDDVTATGQNCSDLFTRSDLGQGVPDVVYRYQPAHDQVVRVVLEALDAGFNPNLVVTTDCGAGTPDVTCVDGLATSDANRVVEVVVRLAEGLSYAFVVDGGKTTSTLTEGRFRLRLEPGQLDLPDDCATALDLTTLPYSVKMTGRNLRDDFGGQAATCTEYMCCQRGEIFDVTSSCSDGLAADWANCEPVCCSQADGQVVSEELLGNCLHYGGDPECGGAHLPVSCCQVFALPQIGYFLAAGCGDPLSGGIQGTPVDSQYCDQVCCEGHGYQKRGNCENFESVSHTFPPVGTGCGFGDESVGQDELDAVFRYTATEDGILVASATYGSSSAKDLYGFVGGCAAGAVPACTTANPSQGRALLPLKAGETGTVVVDGWNPARPFLSNTLTFEWKPGVLPHNDDCATIETITALPALVSSSLAGAENDLAGIDSETCSGLSSRSNGADVVFSVDAGQDPNGVLVGLLRSDFAGILYAIQGCGAELPVYETCLAAESKTGFVNPHLVLPPELGQVTVVVDSEVGSDWGLFDLAVAPATAPDNETCASAAVIPVVPTVLAGSTYGAAADLVVPAYSCKGQMNYSDIGPGRDVVYRLDVTDDLVATGKSLIVKLTGVTFIPALVVLKNGCSTDGSTCLLSSGGTQYTLSPFSFKAGDALYFVVDSVEADGAGGLFALEVGLQ